MLKILLTDLYIVDKMDVPSKYTIVKAVGVSGQSRRAVAETNAETNAKTTPKKEPVKSCVL
jgi:hypothetical protein